MSVAAAIMCIGVVREGIFMSEVGGEIGREADSERMSYLFIDDSRVSRMRIRQVVGQKCPEWELHEAASGEEAHEKTRTLSPDLISVDINMPGMSGLEAIDQLRKNCPLAKIVLLSGNIQDAIRARAIELQVGFVEKPITEASIAKVLAYLE
jgi:two-component system, chemotaxis family, chemotaxis protein CheY